MSGHPTTLSQPTLLDVPAAPRPLTDRQSFVWHLVRVASDGITAEQVGAALHAQKGAHPVGEPCVYCGRDGRAVLTSKALAPLVTFTLKDARGRVYWPRNPRERVREPEHVSEPTEAEIAANPFAGL